ncbi:MAG: UDP-N-acetylmuramate dehydrogenase [Clostridia bacterium]|nr:UDP-N-acetylmuramate dehydrogenase [Clostridia bacterium]
MFNYNYERFLEEIRGLDCTVLRNEPMKKHTTIKIGGNADVFLNIKTEAALIEVLRILNTERIPSYILGNGSNTLVSDSGIRGVVIKLDGDFKKINYTMRQQISCGAGANITRFCLYACDHSLSGFEFLYGIPGTIGGAIYMNAGAYGGEIKDIIISCTHITKSGQKATLPKGDLCFSYRKSFYTSTDNIITRATFKFIEGEKKIIKKTMEDLMQKRKSNQPLNFPNAGSVFKRPVENFAGALIEKAGLKGKTIGGAMVSDKHCGFIVNKNNASCKDVLDLMDLIKEEVYSKTGIMLESEIKILGEH